jgi:hypothetical protein
MRLWLAAVAATAGSLAVSMAQADERFPIQGNYGNGEGCKAIAQQETSSDDLLFLTPEAVGTYAAYCTPLAIWRSGDNGFVAPVTCGHEGEGTITVEHVRIVKADAGRDAYEIFTEDGTSWGEAARCP